MKNIFQFQLHDYAYSDMHACRIDKEIMRDSITCPKPIDILTPIPFSFKVLEGIQGKYYLTKGSWIAIYHNFYVEIHKDKSTKFLYVIDNRVKYYFRHLHSFQGYLRERYNYELPFEVFGSFEHHINDLNLIRDYILVEGKIVLNDKAFNTPRHFGYEDP